jgi:cation diffusion facilitator CzcD-associated flavoprotein CzcO
MMDFRESFHDAVTDSSSEFAELIRSSCMEMMKTQIPDQPSLWEKLTPNYSPGCKRVIISDDYYPAVANPKTTLETNKIRRITETGIELEDGTHHDHDTIVLATGFRTVEFLHPIKVTGAKSRPLAEIWSSGATALYGTT